MASDETPMESSVGSTTSHPLLQGATALPASPFVSASPADEKRLPVHARLHNRTMLLRTLYREGHRSRADLARSSGLTKVSVSEVMADLFESNLVREVGTRKETRRGKPAMLLGFNDESYRLIGVDLSHSTLYRGAVLTLRGDVLHRREVLIEGSLGAEALEKVMDLVTALHQDLDAPLLGVGIGVPGIVDPNGVVINAPNLGWQNLDLRTALQERFGCPGVVANDANVAAFAEHMYGQGADDMILVRIGVGVSAGILLNGTPVLGSRFAAGEIGHVKARTKSDRVCVCGREGCLETWLSTRRLRKDLDAAQDPEERAAVLTTAGQALGATLSPIVAALNTSEIVLSGPIQVLDGLLSTTVSHSIHDRAVTGTHGDLTLRMSALGDDVVLRGATAMVMSNELGIT